MVRSAEIPSMGNLSGVKVVVSASSVACPFAGELLAENGADVIILEPPKTMDPMRYSNNGWTAEAERRNMRSMVLDVTKPEGKDILFKLLAEADIFMEASRGGQWTRWGYTDEVLWEVNKKLVISHQSGYGQTGDPDYVKRPGYDHTVQAYSGTMVLNGFPDRDPVLARQWCTDYYSALITFGSVLAAYINVQKTGEGESIDVAQYEVATRLQGPYVTRYFMEGLQPPREGAANFERAGVGYYKCKDGYGIYTVFIGGPVLKRLFNILGLEMGTELFPEGITYISRGGEDEKVFEKALQDYFASKSADEAEAEMLGQGLPCAKVMDYAAMEKDSHYKARETFIEWENAKGEKVKGVHPVPRFKKNPGTIWRGCPTIGMDTEDILAEIGITDEKYIKNLFDTKILQKQDIVRVG